MGCDGGARRTQRVGHVGRDGWGAWDAMGGVHGMQQVGHVGRDGEGLWDMMGEGRWWGMWDEAPITGTAHLRAPSLPSKSVMWTMPREISRARGGTGGDVYKACVHI